MPALDQSASISPVVFLLRSTWTHGPSTPKHPRRAATTATIGRKRCRGMASFVREGGRTSTLAQVELGLQRKHRSTAARHWNVQAHLFERRLTHPDSPCSHYVEAKGDVLCVVGDIKNDAVALPDGGLLQRPVGHV